MNAGDLRHRVSIQTRTETDDGHGGFTVAWTTVQERVAAQVLVLSGRDLERARQIDPRATHELRLRFWRDYDDAFHGGRARVVWHDTGAVGDRTLELVEPPLELRHRVLLTMTCKELR